MLTFSLQEAAEATRRIRPGGDLGRTWHDLKLVMRDLAELPAREPLAVLCHAHESYPATSYGTALAKLTDQLIRLRDEIALIGDSMRLEHAAERSSMSFKIKAAFRRQDEIRTELDRIEHQSRCGQAGINDRRRVLRDAGVSVSEIERVLPGVSTDELDRQRARLIEERNRIRAFLHSYDDTEWDEAA
ncbi:hypothetical protein [Thiorhodovibrio frisius]|uniref:Uncharacterized protein n=1 Tax=Thiorhodovibrio frisius TaxID=631362 RepID=H8Z6U0_9GAMM|nr:hypothetical protein [Thiorhodovibrio frisius]EIC20806.1 hypothetical protein Thi970DRAFT_04469 [Thiorhodovibrio frisius]WPL21857.1 hypothetical protein Thiofri_01994 [Thiorhodovibrio frisius]